MGLEKYDDQKLLKTTKSLKTVLMVLAVTWLAIFAFYIGTQIYAAEKGNFQFMTAVPFIVGPITLLPVFMSYQNFKKEVAKRGLN